MLSIQFKMNDEKCLIREILLYEFQLGHNVADAIRNIHRAKGEAVLKKSVAYRWFKKFGGGVTDIKDQPRAGRPKTLDPEALREVIEADTSKSVRRLSSELAISKSGVHRQLHELGKVNRHCREIPHELTPEMAKKRIEICQKLLQNPSDQRFFKRIVTCDEKWVYFRNNSKENQWIDRGSTALPVVRRERFEKKVLLCVWWNFEGLVHFELVPDGRTINTELYSAQLERMYSVMRQKYPSLVNRKRVILQQDNAKPHTSVRTQEKIKELELEVLPHPAYSPDLAPSDYYLFRSMAHFLRGRCFENEAEVEVGCREFFASKTTEWYRRGISLLVERWTKTIEHGGLYFAD